MSKQGSWGWDVTLEGGVELHGKNDWSLVEESDQEESV